MTSHTDHDQSRRNWFIQVDGQAYGPFDDKTLWSYMVEGRVNAQSLISQNANMGYRPVAANPGLMNWLDQATAPPAQPPQPEAPLTVFMIMAEMSL